MAIINEDPALGGAGPGNRSSHGGKNGQDNNPNLRGCKVLNFKKLQKNTLQGVFDLELPWGGMVLRGCCLHEKDGKRWIGWPAKPFEKQDGTKSWSNIVDFIDNKAKYLLQDEALPHVLAAMSETRG